MSTRHNHDGETRDHPHAQEHHTETPEPASGSSTAAEHPHAHDDGGHSQDGHGHDHGASRWAKLSHQVSHFVTPHSHEASDKIDSAMEASAVGIRTLWISFVILAVTALFQAVVVAVSGSVALLGDTVHNFADALTAVPLGIAFMLARRPANRRYNYGYGRSEDLAGVVIVLTIAASSAFTAGAAIDRLLHPKVLTHLGVVAGAAVIGFIGNEWVARYRIVTGRRIGSAALVADGLHARSDGFVSLSVLLGAAGVAVGWHWADPVIALLITASLLLVLWSAAREIYRRMMDAVDPALVEVAEASLVQVDGVHAVGSVKMRWIGHSLRAEADIVVDPDITVEQGHHIAVAAEHALIHDVARVEAATVHLDHLQTGTSDPHAPLLKHQSKN